MKTRAELHDDRELDSLAATYPVATRGDVELVGFRSVPVPALRVGDRLDLECDWWADPEMHVDPPPACGSEFQYELAIVHEPVVFEPGGGVLVHTSQGSFAFPYDHAVPVEECDTCEGNGYFFNLDADGNADSAIVVTRCDHCDRFEGDLEAGRHAAKLRGWSVVASAYMREPIGGLYLASLEEGAVCAADGEAPAFRWIGDLIRSDDSLVADGYTDAPYLVEFKLERVR